MIPRGRLLVFERRLAELLARRRAGAALGPVTIVVADGSPEEQARLVAALPAGGRYIMLRTKSK